MAQPEPLMTPADLGRRIGKDVKTLRNWRAAGIGPDYLKLNGTVRYETATVEKWIAGQRVSVASGV